MVEKKHHFYVDISFIIGIVEKYGYIFAGCVFRSCYF